MTTTARIYHQSRDAIIKGSALQIKFAEDAEALTKKLTLLRKRRGSLEKLVTELKEKVQQQLNELLRSEVEVGMTLRSCLGSCVSARQFPVVLEDIALLQSQTEQTNSPSHHAMTPPNILEIHTAPIDLGPEPNPVYKTIKMVLSEGLDLFEHLQQPQLLLHERLDSSD